MDLTVRPIEASEFETFRAKMARGFGCDPYPQDDPVFFRKIIELERTVAAFDGDELVGTCGAFSFDLTVAGGTLPMGGTTIITVQPTHRRRGVLRAMMTAHLDEIRERGEPLAGLWASETSIYGRFGFGQAADPTTSSSTPTRSSSAAIRRPAKCGSSSLPRRDRRWKLFTSASGPRAPACCHDRMRGGSGA